MLLQATAPGSSGRSCILISFCFLEYFGGSVWKHPSRWPLTTWEMLRILHLFCITFSIRELWSVSPSPFHFYILSVLTFPETLHLSGTQDDFSFSCINFEALSCPLPCIDCLSTLSGRSHFLQAHLVMHTPDQAIRDAIAPLALPICWWALVSSCLTQQSWSTLSGPI